MLNLRVGQVDLAQKTIRLEVGETKNGEGRVAVMPSCVYALIVQCVQGKSADDHVFTRRGRPIGDIRPAWYQACCAAGVGRMTCKMCGDVVVSSQSPTWKPCPTCKNKIDNLKYDGLIFHDLRRTAVRNMIRRGIPEVVAMRISGHKTRAIFDRYNIVSERDLRDAAAMMDRPLPTIKYDFARSDGEGHLESAETKPEMLN